ncbi:hypothetical protein GJAV_G00251850 [Gymnothorax javanicus]|nr:hypothetical protein GJAV_G00251850 [Gymnothorax javanicus]
MSTDDIQDSLCQLCRAVFYTKGWWPTVKQMLRWSALVLTEKGKALELVGVEEDQCVTAMFAATQVLLGNRLDIVLSSDIDSEEQIKEWSDFYKHLGISVATNMKKNNASRSDVYEADIVYGTMHDFVSDYLQYGLDVMGREKRQLSRGFIIEERSVTASHKLELLTLKDNDDLAFAAEILQSLMGKFHSEDMELRHRDAEEWTNFYLYFDITADTNTNKTKDEDRKECYRKDVVYGTIEAFAADHLRQTFEMKDVRPDRSYQCIIIDEVDSLLLDQGVQLTYLSSPMVSMQHLNVILSMIWSHVSQYSFLSTGHHTFVQGPPASFFKAIFDSIDTVGTEINDPLDILRIAEESNTVPKGFTEDIHRSGQDELLKKLKTVSQDAVVDFFQEIEHYVPYGFTVYTLDDNGLLYLRKPSPYSNQDIPHLTFLVLEEGLCHPLYDSEEILITPIAELISEKIQYIPCTKENKISIPGFLRNLIEKKVSVWVQNAFLAMRLKQGREYVVVNDSVCPVDFRSTGIIELNKKWGDGLQQFIEIKHRIKLSTISTVTNYVSNISFFQKYHGKIYGTTGTLGSRTDILFLQDLYPNLSACKMPSFNRKKLFEVKGTLKTSTEEWKCEIKCAVLAQVCPNSYRNGRAALVICETINKAKEIYKELRHSIPGEIILYCRSDKDSLSKIDKELLPGDVIVATNLAGRGTDIKVSKQVNNNGGLFVILSFLPENTRVELQAFGRTARKGKPGSAQLIVSTDHLQQSFRMVYSLEDAKKIRERLAAEKITHMMNDVTEMKLREDLFSVYCQTLQEIHKNTDVDEKTAIVAIMNEFWGIWLQIKSGEIDQLNTNELREHLKKDLSQAKRQSQSLTSPSSSIYHYIKFGNIALNEKQWEVSARLFEKAMKQDECWAAIAFYSHSYCTIKQQKEDYLSKARDELRKAQESLKYLSEESMICLQFVKMSSADSANSDQTSLEKQLLTKCSMLGYFDKNIREAIKKLEEIKERNRDAVATKCPVFSLVSNADEDLQAEAYSLYNQGLKYVFSVEEKPRFPWEALLVFFLGVIQIIGGTLLTWCTFGTLAQIGIGLITEGISDCIHGIESMVTGEFSWKSWATEKAISIGISLIGFGVGKLIAKGFKASKTLIKGFGRELKSMPEFLSRQAKDGLSTVATTNVKNAVKQTGKIMVEEILRVLSETTGTKVVILTEDSHGKLTKMQELNPDSKPATKTVTLIYSPKSAQHPDGHYDVLINNKAVSIASEGKSCLFHALARGMKPEGSEKEITSEANRLRSVEADALLRYPGQWEPFINRKEWTETIRGGDWNQVISTLKQRSMVTHEELVGQEQDLMQEVTG